MAAWEVKEVVPAALVSYERFLAASPQGTFFAGGPWLDLLGNALPGRVYALAFEAAGETRALIPVWETAARWLGPTAEIPPLTPYWGPCLPAAEDLKADRVRARDHETLEAAAEEMKRRFAYARVVCHPTLGDVRPLTWAGFGSAVRYTAIVKPASAAAFWEGLPSALRNKLKQGDGKVTVKAVDMNPFLPLYRETFGRRGMKPPVEEAFLTALGRLFPEHGGVFYLGGENGAAAGRVMLWDRHYAYDLLAAAGEEGRGPLGAWLFSEVIKMAWARGVPLDVVGVNVPSIARFKESFGGDLVPYYLLTYFRSTAARALVSARRRWGR
jgi:hypothetical protein